MVTACRCFDIQARPIHSHTLNQNTERETEETIQRAKRIRQNNIKYLYGSSIIQKVSQLYIYTKFCYFGWVSTSFRVILWFCVKSFHFYLFCSHSSISVSLFLCSSFPFVLPFFVALFIRYTVPKSLSVCSIFGCIFWLKMKMGNCTFVAEYKRTHRKKRGIDTKMFSAIVLYCCSNHFHGKICDYIWLFMV